MKSSLHPLLRTLALAGALCAGANWGHATIAVSNITTADNWWWNVESLSSFESFTVGPDAMTLQGFNFKMSWTAGSSAHVDVHSSSGSSYGGLLASSAPALFATAGQGTASIPTPPLLLQANTTYFLHVVRDEGAFSTVVSSTPIETGLPGWSIGNQSWLIAASQWSTGVPMFAVDVTSAVPEPSTAALALGAVGLGVVLYRRRPIAAKR